MNKQRKAILVVAAVTFLLLASAVVLASRHRANTNADAIMQPTFQQGWYRGKTMPIFRLDGRWQLAWLIQYEMEHPTAIVDFGPQFVISWSGETIMMSPNDLNDRIMKNAETDEQSGAAYRR